MGVLVIRTNRASAQSTYDTGYQDINRGGRTSMVLDSQTRFNAKGTVDNGQSARANLRALGDDALNAVNPTNIFAATYKGISKFYDDLGLGGVFLWPLAPIFYVLGTIVALIGEALELALLPAFLLKDLSDAGVHALMTKTKPEDALPEDGIQDLMVERRNGQYDNFVPFFERINTLQKPVIAPPAPKGVNASNPR
jgi:hypothetical protein